MEDVELPDLNEIPTETPRAVVRDAAEENYSSKVQKRINLEISRRKAAQDRADNAEARIQQLERQFQQQSAQRIGADEQVITSQVAGAQAALRRAKEMGDLDAEMLAHGQLVDLQVSLNATRNAKVQAERAVEQAPQQNAKPPVSSAMKEWLDSGNADWFNKDDAMTTASVAFDKAARRAGIEPESAEYFRFIDKKMRSAFAEHFDDGAEEEDDVEIVPERPSRPVAAAPARRSTTPNTTPASNKTIRLTAEEMEVAKALGMTAQQYAANKTAKY